MDLKKSLKNLSRLIKNIDFYNAQKDNFIITHQNCLILPSTKIKDESYDNLLSFRYIFNDFYV